MLFGIWTKCNRPDLHRAFQPRHLVRRRNADYTSSERDEEEFRLVAAAITRSGERMTMYANPNDKALLVSRHLHAHPRVGEKISVVPLIDTIDASAVDTSFLCHSAYGDNRTVLSDIDQLLRTGAAPDDRTGSERRDSPDGTYHVIRP